MHIHTIQLNIEKVVGGTAHMDAAEFGAYMALIIVAYQQKGKLPDDDGRLARMAKCTPKVWSRVRPVVSPKFTISGGFWTHSVVLEQLETYKRLSTKNRNNRLKNKETVEPVVKPKRQSGPTNTNNNNQVTSKKNIEGASAPAAEGKKSNNGKRFEEWHAGGNAPPEGFHRYAADRHGWDIKRIDEVFRAFRRYWASPDANRPVKKDWAGAWENWVDREARNQPSGRARPAGYNPNLALELALADQTGRPAGRQSGQGIEAFDSAPDPGRSKD